MNRDEYRRAAEEAVIGCERLITQIEGSSAASVLLADEALNAVPTTADWDALYAFQMKFMLLQDLASRRLIRALIALAGSDPAGVSAREAVDRAANLEALTSADEWLDLILIRNSLAHDYPIDEHQFILRLQDAWRATEILIVNVRRLIAALQERGLQ